MSTRRFSSSGSAFWPVARLFDEEFTSRLWRRRLRLTSSWCGSDSLIACSMVPSITVASIEPPVLMLVFNRPSIHGNFSASEEVGIKILWCGGTTSWITLGHEEANSSLSRSRRIIVRMGASFGWIFFHTGRSAADKRMEEKKRIMRRTSLGQFSWLVEDLPHIRVISLCLLWCPTQIMKALNDADGGR